MNHTSHYPEMNGTHTANALQVEYLAGQWKVSAAPGVELPTNRSIVFQYVNNSGRNVYYATSAGLKQLKKHFNTSTAILLD